jgi:altronate hydrolase
MAREATERPLQIHNDTGYHDRKARCALAARGESDAAMSDARPAVLLAAPDDDVAVALRALAPGQAVTVAGAALRVAEPIAMGHKVARRLLAAGAEVRKYGAPIGVATRAIPAGAHVHTHNLASTLDGAVDAATPRVSTRAPGGAVSNATFMGYERADGRVGVRNELWIIPTVGCVARTGRRIAEQASPDLPNSIDGAHAFTHPFGCSQLGDDLDRTRAILAALARHPNAGGVLLVGLGCESNQLADLVAEADLAPERLAWFDAQSADDEVAEGVARLHALAEAAAADRRAPVPVAKLVLGLKCGGSDGLSGLTANPLVGRIADRVTDEGGSAILTEIPETFGAEHRLAGRAADDATQAAALALVSRFKRYFTDQGLPVTENPSPGNIEGGVTTLEEKALGAVQKGGRARLTDVLDYATRIRRPGLTLLEAPGNDAVSSTALAASGASIILFTTGRGTPLGFPVPTLKIASNSEIARKKPHWIDFDAGVLLDGADPAETADALFDLVLETASGRPAKNERNDEREIAIWKTGVTL